MANSCSSCGLKDAPHYDDDGKCPLCSDHGRQNGSYANSIAGKLATMQRKGNLSILQQAALDAVLEHDGSIRAAAAARGVNHGIISMALDGKETPAAYKALGVRKTKHFVVAFHLEDPDTAVALRRIFDAHGRNRQEVARKIVNGELIIRERDDERND